MLGKVVACITDQDANEYTAWENARAHGLVAGRHWLCGHHKVTLNVTKLSLGRGVKEIVKTYQAWLKSWMCDVETGAEYAISKDAFFTWLRSPSVCDAVGPSGVEALDKYACGSFLNIDRKLCRHLRIYDRYFDEWTNSNTEGRNAAVKCNSKSGNKSGTRPSMSIATSVSTMNDQSTRQYEQKRRAAFAGYANVARWTDTESGQASVGHMHCHSCCFYN